MNKLFTALMISGAVLLSGCGPRLYIYRDPAGPVDLSQAKSAVTTSPKTVVASKKYRLSDQAEVTLEWEWEKYQAAADSFLTAELQGLYPNAPKGNYDGCLLWEEKQPVFITEIIRRMDLNRKDSIYANLPTVSPDCDGQGATHLVVAGEPQLYPVFEVTVTSNTYVDHTGAISLAGTTTKEQKLYPVVLLSHGVWNLAEKRWDRVLAKEVVMTTLEKKPKAVRQNIRADYLKRLPHPDESKEFLNLYANDPLRGFSIKLTFAGGSFSPSGGPFQSLDDLKGKGMSLGARARYLHNRLGGEVGYQWSGPSEEEYGNYDLEISRIQAGPSFVLLHNLQMAKFGDRVGAALVARGGFSTESVGYWSVRSSNEEEYDKRLYGFYLGGELEMHIKHFLISLGVTHNRTYSDPVSFATTLFEMGLGTHF